MANRRDMKMYIRYDYAGRIIPSSNILSRVKPKVGDWTEIAAEECCGGCVPIYVCNAGTEGANGIYTCGGMVNNKPFYTKDDYRLSWGEYPYGEDFYQEWDIWDADMNPLYYTGGDDDTPTPVTAEYWLSEDGDDPAPTVQLDECDPYSCLCESVLTVGGNGRSIWGYIIENFGSLTPNCSSIVALAYFTGEGNSALILATTETLKDCMVVNIDGTDYELPYSYEGPYGYEYVLFDGENPFPEPGETCTIIIDCLDNCSTTTTTTICVPEGGFLGITSFSSSYTPTVGAPISFIDSEEETCAAILVVEGNGGEFDYFDVDIYLVGEDNHYYLPGTCDELPDGYYVINVDDTYFGEHVTDGVIDEYDICATTTTTTTEEETTTTTTTVEP